MEKLLVGRSTCCRPAKFRVFIEVLAGRDDEEFLAVQTSQVNAVSALQALADGKGAHL